jgi:hypothetical protein
LKSGQVCSAATYPVSKVPAVETLEKLARALEVPMYQLFHDGEAAASVRKLKLPNDSEEWGTTGPTADYFAKLRRLLSENGT